MPNDPAKMNRRSFLATGVAGAALGTGIGAFAASTAVKSEWKGRTAFITGGNSGIGRATALALSGFGSQVAICGRNPEKAAAVVKECLALGGKAAFFRADVRNPAEVREAVRKSAEKFGRIHMALNAAGISEKSGEFHREDPAAYLDTIDTNLVGTMHCLQAELEQMLKQGGPAAIINIASSITAGRSAPDTPAYTASKYGVVGLSKAAATAYAANGIRVNVVSPGFLDHQMGGSNEPVSNDSDYANSVKGRVPLGRLIRVEEVVQGILWLSADASSGITGHNLMIDGGR